MSQPLNCQTSEASTAHLKEVILQVQPFNTEVHGKCMSAGRTKGLKDNTAKKTADNNSPVCVQKNSKEQKSNLRGD
eukprot:1387906-Ditylum_brightwellii.AAC.1